MVSLVRRTVTNIIYRTRWLHALWWGKKLFQFQSALALLIVSALSVLKCSRPLGGVRPPELAQLLRGQVDTYRLPCNWEFAHRLDIFYGLPLTCPSMWSVVLADHPHGACTVHWSLYSLIFSFVFGIGIQSPTNGEKIPYMKIKGWGRGLAIP